MCAHQVPSYGRPMTTDGASEPATDAPPTGHPTVPRYEIRVSGRLDPRWAAWFDGLDLAAEDDGITVLRGAVVDQAALHGLLQKLRDVGIPLVSLAPMPPDTDAADLPSHPIPHNPSGATS